MHGCLRAVLNQGKVWELVGPPAQGIRLPHKKARRPPVVRAKQDIRRVIEAFPEPTSETKRQNGLAQSHFAVGKIHYSSSPVDDGVIVYLISEARVGSWRSDRRPRLHGDESKLPRRHYGKPVV